MSTSKSISWYESTLGWLVDVVARLRVNTKENEGEGAPVPIPGRAPHPKVGLLMAVTIDDGSPTLRVNQMRFNPAAHTRLEVGG